MNLNDLFSKLAAVASGTTSPAELGRLALEANELADKSLAIERLAEFAELGETAGHAPAELLSGPIATFGIDEVLCLVGERAATMHAFASVSGTAVTPESELLAADGGEPSASVRQAFDCDLDIGNGRRLVRYLTSSWKIVALGFPADEVVSIDCGDRPMLFSDGVYSMDLATERKGNTNAVILANEPILVRFRDGSVHMLTNAVPEPLWRPSKERVAISNIKRFVHVVEEELGEHFNDYGELYTWSIKDPNQFWSAVWRYSGVIPLDHGSDVLVDSHKMPGAKWFPEARLNFTENLLRRRDETPAIIFRGENGVRIELRWSELYDAVSRFSQALAQQGIQAGDRVVGVVANTPETVVAVLATAAVGAVWASCSPDFGVDAIVDRFSQLEPSVLIVSDRYQMRGESHEIVGHISQLVARLPSVRKTVVLPYPESRLVLPPQSATNVVSHSDFLAGIRPQAIAFERYPFDHPLYVLFSSGTTGKPKGLVHGAGGTLLQHLKEHQLHCDIRPNDRVFYYTNSGWMMWNWLITALASEATIVLYDGSPFHPNKAALLDIAKQEELTLFGVSAKYLDILRRAEIRDTDGSLDSVRVITSTGSPLSPESFEYVYSHLKQDVQLSSVSGGTDIISCFALGNPIAPVWRGELQTRGLGMNVQVFNDLGQSVIEQKGELVCTAPFPSMPLGFVGDIDGKRFDDTYFRRYHNVWHHGDYAKLNTNGGLVIYGRSDATLNPGGVRVGTAEIYSQVEKFPEVAQCVAVEQQHDQSSRIVLFVVMEQGHQLTPELRERIRQQIRTATSSHHVPRKIVEVSDLPRTRNGKISELAVREVIHGRELGNREALENPDSLELFRQIPELRF